MVTLEIRDVWFLQMLRVASTHTWEQEEISLKFFSSTTDFVSGLMRLISNRPTLKKKFIPINFSLKALISYFTIKYSANKMNSMLYPRSIFQHQSNQYFLFYSYLGWRDDIKVFNHCFNPFIQSQLPQNISSFCLKIHKNCFDVTLWDTEAFLFQIKDI